MCDFQTKQMWHTSFFKSALMILYNNHMLTTWAVGKFYQFMLLIQTLHQIIHLLLMYLSQRGQTTERRLLVLPLLLQLFLKLFGTLQNISNLKIPVHHMYIFCSYSGTGYMHLTCNFSTEDVLLQIFCGISYLDASSFLPTNFLTNVMFICHFVQYLWLLW